MTNFKAWQLWAHYLALFALLFFYSQYAMESSSSALLTWLGFLAVLIIGDLTIHTVLRITTGWRD